MTPKRESLEIASLAMQAFLEVYDKMPSRLRADDEALSGKERLKNAIIDIQSCLLSL